MEKKFGVYICTGCDIGDSLDIEALTKEAGSHPVLKTHEFLCGEEGTAMINEDIKNEELNAIVIGACSARAMADAFRLDAPIVERVNLREHVVWSHEPNDEATQLLAEDYMRLGIIKARKTEPADPHIEETSKVIMVIGGGLTGCTAALEAAAAGYEVVIVEKNGTLGGHTAGMYKDLPQSAPYTDLSTPAIGEKVKAVEAEEKIRVFTGSTIASVAGQPGLFDAAIKTGESEETVRVGSIVLATGAVPYDASKLGHLGYGSSPDVITSGDLEAMAATGDITRPSDGKKAASVTFIQCAGSRDKDHLPYCSSACCANSLKQAAYVREKNPDATVTIIYRDMRTPGHNEHFYAAAQNDPGIFMTKGDVTGVAPNGGNIAVTAENTLVGENIKIESDLVVLATGMVPTTLTDPIVNLQYRQGPALPSLNEAYGFPDSHFICFPYETQRTGIYTAGTVRHPMDSAGSVSDAAGAALKAIHCVELTSQGRAVHPRVGDSTFPEFYLNRCTQCKRCTEECPFGTLDEDEKGTPKPNPFRCRRCGVCMGACPERIISFNNYSVDMISSMMKEVEVPDDEDIPCVIGLICENDAYPALDLAGINRLKYSPHIRFIPLRCAGGTNLVWVSDALSKGVDGIMIFGCKHGDDYQCHFVKGSELCGIRLSKVQETLDRIQLEADRVRLYQLSINEYDQIPGLIEEFMEDLEEFGPNPFKGF
jgi:quinone-modifying oxidoreductase subunit QmoB